MSMNQYTPAWMLEDEVRKMSNLGNKLGKRALIDFDGTLHKYTTKFTHETEIHDGPIDGAIQFIRDLFDAGFDVAIFSTRASSSGFKDAALDWFEKYGMPRKYSYQLEFTNIKGHHEFILDDRGINFSGVYPTIESLKSFRPWNKREKLPIREQIMNFIGSIKIENEAVAKLGSMGIHAEKEVLLAVLESIVDEVRK
jgi:hypothetical protein